MATLSSVTPYATEAEATAILGNDSPWVASSVPLREAALIQGKIYIDSYYKCTIDLNDIPENVKEANALLANEHLIQGLFERQSGLGTLAETSVEAASVKTTKKYNINKSGTSGAWVDPFAQITSLLKQGDVCSLTVSSIRQVRLLRN